MSVRSFRREMGARRQRSKPHSILQTRHSTLDILWLGFTTSVTQFCHCPSSIRSDQIFQFLQHLTVGVRGARERCSVRSFFHFWIIPPNRTLLFRRANCRHTEGAFCNTFLPSSPLPTIKIRWQHTVLLYTTTTTKPCLKQLFPLGAECSADVEPHQLACQK